MQRVQEELRNEALRRMEERKNFVNERVAELPSGLESMGDGDFTSLFFFLIF